MNSLDDLKKKTNRTRLSELSDLTYLQEEVALLSNHRVLDYYWDIYENVELDRNNPQNSYFMWLLDKVDVIDQTKPAKIKEDRTSLPDIDCDASSSGKQAMLDYLAKKYGQSKVAQFITFMKIKGAKALYLVLSSNTEISPAEIFDITKRLPVEHKITAELKAMKDKIGYSSIIRYGLLKSPKKFANWCTLIESPDGDIWDGDYAAEFQYAIQLEGLNAAQSKHPAGVIVSDVDIIDYAPLILDSEGHYVCGFEMGDVEATGFCKIDLLSIQLLDKLENTSRITKGEMSDR